MRSSVEVRAASAIALRSGLATSRMVVAPGSHSARHRSPEARLLGLQARMWALGMKRPDHSPLQKAAPGLGKAEKPQCMPRRRSIEDDVIIGSVLVGQTAGEFVERGDLGGAGARQLLSNPVSILVACAGVHLSEHTHAIRFRCHCRVDVEHIQILRTRNRHRGSGAGNRGLSDPALAGEEQKACRIDQELRWMNSVVVQDLTSTHGSRSARSAISLSRYAQQA